VGVESFCAVRAGARGQRRYALLLLGITAKMTSKHGSSYHLDFQTTGFE
jgi:hypothetical protein